MNIQDRIVQLMKRHNLRQIDLVRKTGATKGTVNQWVSGAIRPSKKFDKVLAEALHTTIDYLYHGIESKASLTESLENVIHIDAWDSKTPLNDDEVEVAFYMGVELAAGIGFNEMIEVNGPKLRFSKSTLRRSGVDPVNAVCVKVSGNSMEPRLYDGDVVGIDLGSKDIADGKTYAINHDGLLRVKRLYRIPGGGIRINSLNGQEHPDEVCMADERNNIVIVGKVFWSSSMWN